MTTHVTPTPSPSAAPARTTPTLGWPLFDLIKKIIPRRAGMPTHYSPPAVRPLDREPVTVDGIDRYAPGAPVWAYIGGAWLTARVADTIGSSALVTYPAPGSADTMVETVHITHLQLCDRPDQNSHGDTSPASISNGSAHLPAAGEARVVLGMHYPDEHGMCTGCADLAHFCWAPCPRAREAMTALGIVPITRFGAQ